MTAYGDSTEVRLAPAGRVFIAPSGTVLPTNVTTAMTTVSPLYKELGYLSEDGVALTPNLDSSGVKAWQSAVDVKTTVTGVGLQAKFTMIQITQETTAEYFFGSAWINSGGVGKLIISSTPSLAERVMVVEWNDDADNTNRLVCGRGFLTDRDAMNLQRTEATALGVTFQCLDNAGTLAFVLSNDPDLIPAS